VINFGGLLERCRKSEGFGKQKELRGELKEKGGETGRVRKRWRRGFNGLQCKERRRAKGIGVGGSKSVTGLET
jgi:hypothetical protein